MPSQVYLVFFQCKWAEDHGHIDRIDTGGMWVTAESKRKAAASAVVHLQSVPGLLAPMVNKVLSKDEWGDPEQFEVLNG